MASGNSELVTCLGVLRISSHAGGMCSFACLFRTSWGCNTTGDTVSVRRDLAASAYVALIAVAGAVVGAIAGAVVGAVVDAVAGAVAGAVEGAVAGAVVDAVAGAVVYEAP